MRAAEGYIRHFGDSPDRAFALVSRPGEAIHPDDLKQLQRVARITERTGGPRLSESKMREAEDFIRHFGDAPERAFALVSGRPRGAAIHPDDLAHLQTVAAETSRTGGPRLNARSMLEAEERIRHRGESPEQAFAAAIRRPGARIHRDDLARLQTVALDTHRAGGPRLDAPTMRRAEARIRNLGESPEQAYASALIVSRPGMTVHPDDLAHLQAIAASERGN